MCKLIKGTKDALYVLIDISQKTTDASLSSLLVKRTNLRQDNASNVSRDIKYKGTVVSKSNYKSTTAFRLIKSIKGVSYVSKGSTLTLTNAYLSKLLV